MSKHDSDSLLDTTRWGGRIFDGDWIAAHGGTLAVTEPASGERLHEVGQADAQDVARAV
ncbi:benzaldehyde dehydrogenase, partial [Xanthomonas sp. Kuri4-2]